MSLDQNWHICTVATRLATKRFLSLLFTASGQCRLYNIEWLNDYEWWSRKKIEIRIVTRFKMLQQNFRKLTEERNGEPHVPISRQLDAWRQSGGLGDVGRSDAMWGQWGSRKHGHDMTLSSRWAYGRRQPCVLRVELTADHHATHECTLVIWRLLWWIMIWDSWFVIEYCTTLYQVISIMSIACGYY
jgi:hypothetical protein